MAKSKLTVSEQIDVVSHLSQSAAAHLMGCTLSWLKDHVADLPRNRDGSYSGPELFSWRAKRADDVSISEDQFERVLQASDLITHRLAEGGHAVRRLLVDLQDRYGADGLATFAETVLESLDDAQPGRPTETGIEAEIERDVDSQRQLRLSQMYDNRLESVHRCPTCKKVRRGRKWVADSKRHTPEAGCAEVCPKCEPKSVEV